MLFSFAIGISFSLNFEDEDARMKQRITSRNFSYTYKSVANRIFP